MNENKTNIVFWRSKGSPFIENSSSYLKTNKKENNLTSRAVILLLTTIICSTFIYLTTKSTQIALIILIYFLFQFSFHLILLKDKNQTNENKLNTTNINNIYKILSSPKRNCNYALTENSLIIQNKSVSNPVPSQIVIPYCHISDFKIIETIGHDIGTIQVTTDICPDTLNNKNNHRQTQLLLPNIEDIQRAITVYKNQSLAPEII